VNNSAERANQVWERLLGCFGDSLIRKFDETPPPEWVAGIGSLNDHQLAKGMRRLVLSGKGHPPTLPEFLKLCRTIGYTDDVPEPPALPLHPALEGPQLGPWEMLANRRMLKYVTTKIPENTRRYGNPPIQSNAKFAANVNTLVALKNRWLELMLASATDDGVPIKEQEDCWDECMRQAEAIISESA
jgi:hypothetical protein